MQIKHVELYSHNLEEVAAFYSHILNLPIQHQTADAITFEIGYSTLTFKKSSKPVGIYHFALLIPGDSVQQAYAWLKSRTPVLPFNEESDIADFTNWNAQAMYFHDQHQNIVELIAHHELPYKGQDPFSEKSLVGICEIGLVVADVDAACQQLHRHYHIPYFSKGPYLKDFAVMGEEDGLLIISTEGRGWLPTGQAAVQNRLKAVVEVGGAVNDIVMDPVLVTQVESH